MKAGDLVKRKPKWGEWVEHNPWMYTQKDLEIGLIVQPDVDLVLVHWPVSGPGWNSKEDLEIVNESR
tara:strand:+ start:42 stop:242 length:201 start_codon:yes stop_codon:yes gene_type:complete